MSLYPRPCYWMRRMSGYAIPRHIISVETYSDRIDGAGTDLYYPSRLRCAVLSYCKVEHGKICRIKTLQCSAPETAWQFVYSTMRKRQSPWLIGHRVLESFNLLGGWGRIERGDLQLKTLVDADPPSLLVLQHGEESLHVCDSRNWGDESVETLAESIKERLYPSPDEFSGDGEIYQYLQARCITVRDWFASLLIAWHEERLGKFRCTASGLAWSAYRTNHIPRGILVHNCAESLEMERNALAGGYTRVFRAGEYHGSVHVYDVNSLYPSVMSSHTYPGEYRFWLEDCTLDQLRQATEKHHVIAECAVDQDEYPYPARANGERCWPYGRYYTTLCGDELLHAIEHDHIKRVWRISVYWPVDMFSSWVRSMYGRRLDAAAKRRPAAERMCKLLLNSLCGRLGMRRQGWEFTQWDGWRPQWGFMPDHDHTKIPPSIYRCIAGHVQVRMPDSETDESMPAVEAVINSNARYRMYRDRQVIGEQHILYQGVDSLHVTAEGSERLQALLPSSPNQLGAYKLVSTHNYACYRGPMDYTLDDVHTICGLDVPVGAKKGVPLDYAERDTARMYLTRDPAGVIWTTKRSRVWGHLHVDGILRTDNRVDPPLIQTAVSGDKERERLKVLAWCPDWSQPMAVYVGDNECVSTCTRKS